LADIFSEKKRSSIMRKIGSRDTSPELKTRNLISSLGYSYKNYSPKLPGKPDIVFSRRKKVIFVHGCFWHGHICRRAKLPQTNKAFWKKKIAGNKLRDRRVRKELANLGWKSLVVWQCQITKVKEKKLKNKLRKFLSSPN
jgi:DNA mismatch endonuclease, patch repair protein